MKFIVDELNIRDIYIQDDNFCADLKRFRDIVHNIIKEDIDIVWGLLGARVNSIEQMDNEFLSMVSKAGCKNIDVGIESGNERVLNLIKEDITVPQVLSVNRKLSKFPFKIKEPDVKPDTNDPQNPILLEWKGPFNYKCEII